jgi:hypothetical protein
MPNHKYNKMISRVTIEIAGENGQFGYGFHKDDIKWDIDPAKEEISITSARYVYIDSWGEEGYYKEFELRNNLLPFEYKWGIHRRGPLILEPTQSITIPWDAKKLRVKIYSDTDKPHCVSCTCKRGLLEEHILDISVSKFTGQNVDRQDIKVINSSLITHIEISWGYDEGFSLGQIRTINSGKL